MRKKSTLPMLLTLPRELQCFISELDPEVFVMYNLLSKQAASTHFNHKFEKEGRWINKPTKDKGRIVATFSGGKQNGKWREWHCNGKMLQECHYIQGTLHGELKQWWAGGERRKQANYTNGVLHGQVTFYYPTGNLWEQAEYKNGVLQKNKYWLPGGTAISQN